MEDERHSKILCLKIRDSRRSDHTRKMRDLTKDLTSNMRVVGQCLELWDVQHRIRKMGGVEYCHGRMMGCAAPLQNNGICDAVPREDKFYVQCHTRKIGSIYSSSVTGGRWDVQRHTRKMGVIELCLLE